VQWEEPNVKTQEERRDQLEARRRELIGRLRRIERDLDQPVSATFSEQAQEREDEEVLEDLGHAGQQEIRMIDAALKRIEAGEYGTCMRCGEPIAEARLDSVPHAPLCRDCAG
jgi:RNA polymerase-binding transcription factor DksA